MLVLDTRQPFVEHGIALAELVKLVEGVFVAIGGGLLAYQPAGTVGKPWLPPLSDGIGRHAEQLGDLDGGEGGVRWIRHGVSIPFTDSNVLSLPK